MFEVKINEEKTLLLKGAVKAEIAEGASIVIFTDEKGLVVACFNLVAIEGFFKYDSKEF